MNAHKINGVPRTGASATEGGLETVVENSVVLDGSAMNQIINIDIENMQATGAMWRSAGGTGKRVA
ncbi:putative FAD-binding oxidoreductase [Escherichia coli]|uniref:Putative FAD-binding oxidoreductase n=1 Tax=Escherichia coli TaxID=562 RepID=A0A376WA11_ECOLX|nr:putative FAD-binding oxidoreductase [Escherichia coli]